MATLGERPFESARVSASYVQWSAVIAGAIAAAAISLILVAFGAAIGLAVSSTSPTWRDASFALWLLSGLYLVFVALVSFGFGGYVAGRLHVRFALPAREQDFRDGMHGFLSWGLAVLLGAVLTLGAAASATNATVPTSGASGAPASVAGENMIAYELDRLLRSDRPAAEANVTYRRAEAARILLTASGHDGLAVDDRDYLVRLVSARSGVSTAEAQSRVDDAIGRAKQSIARARHAAVLEAFLTAVALLLGAAVAWFAAGEGGRDRERGEVFAWTWGSRRRVIG